MCVSMCVCMMCLCVWVWDSCPCKLICTGNRDGGWSVYGSTRQGGSCMKAMLFIDRHGVIYGYSDLDKAEQANAALKDGTRSAPHSMFLQHARGRHALLPWITRGHPCDSCIWCRCKQHSAKVHESVYQVQGGPRCAFHARACSASRSSICHRGRGTSPIQR